MRNKSTATVTIPAAFMLSGPVNLGDKILSAIIMSAAWTAAPLTFQASEDGGLTWNNLYDATGAEITIASAAVVAGRRISLDPSLFASVDMIKIRSGTFVSMVTQPADRTLTLISRKYYALD